MIDLCKVIILYNFAEVSENILQYFRFNYYIHLFTLNLAEGIF